MAQWLSTFKTIAEDLDFVPSIHMVGHNPQQLQFWGGSMPTSDIYVHQEPIWYTDIQAKHLYTYF